MNAKTGLLAVLLLLAPLAAFADSIVAGLSQNRVSITATFVGSEILIFGAVKRDEPPPEDDPLRVVVVVEGPKGPITVRRSAQRRSAANSLAGRLMLMAATRLRRGCASRPPDHPVDTAPRSAFPLSPAGSARRCR